MSTVLYCHCISSTVLYCSVTAAVCCTVSMLQCCDVHRMALCSLNKPQFPCKRVAARWGSLECDDKACEL